MLERLRFVLLGLLMLSGSAWAAQSPALLTIVNGPAQVLRDDAKLTAAEGVALQAQDIVEVPATGQWLCLEFGDGARLLLGPGSRLLLEPRLPGARAQARGYLLSGRAKLEAPPNVNFKLLTPLLDLSGQGARATLVLSDGGAQLFSEVGEWDAHVPGAAAFTIKRGDFASVAAGGHHEIAGSPSPAFIQALPRAFLDTLPPRAALFQGKTVAARNAGIISYADAQPWLDSEPALRRTEVSRWRPLARDSAFRQSLIAGLKSHPEWEPILFPPVPASAAKKY